MAPIKDGETRALASKNGQILVKAMTGMPIFLAALSLYMHAVNG